MKAFGYVRVSTEEQAREGLSLEGQEAKIRGYASVHDLELVEIVRDEGYSGKSLKRPGLSGLLKRIAGEEREALIVWKLDRLTRSTRDLLHLVEDVFKESGTRFLSISEQIDTESATGRFFLTIMGAMAQMERELVGERTKLALSAKREKGEYTGGIPYGWRMEGKVLVREEREQEQIAKMRSWRKQGLSYKEIAYWLNEEGVHSKREGAKWGPSAVYYAVKYNKPE